MLTHHTTLFDGTPIAAGFIGTGAETEIVEALTLDGTRLRLSDFDRAWIENEIVDQAATWPAEERRSRRRVL